MNAVIINGSYERLPQPPDEIQDALGHGPIAIGHVALEHALAMNSSEVRAAAIGALKPEDQRVRDVRKSIVAGWLPGVPRITKTQIDRIFASAVQTGIVNHNEEKDAVRQEPGSELVVAMANHFLGVAQDTEVPIGSVLATQRSEAFDWQSFNNLHHLRRLLLFMRIGEAGSEGIDIIDLQRGTDEKDPLKLVAVHGTVHTLEEWKLVRVDVDGNSLQRAYPTERLSKAHDKLNELFESLAASSDDFIDKSIEVRKRVKPNLPHLMKRYLSFSGHSINYKSKAFHDEVMAFIDTHPEGLTTDQIFHLFRERYKDRKAVSVRLSKVANEMPGAEYRFYREPSETNQGVWQRKMLNNGFKVKAANDFYQV